MESSDHSVRLTYQVKFPSTDECAKLSLRMPERNTFAARVLDVALPAAVRAPLVLSSFDPDICIVLARTQSLIPVLFLTEGGTGDPPRDARCGSLAAAFSFAAAKGLAGVVTNVAALLACPSAARLACELGLALATYGRTNSDPDVCSWQLTGGVIPIADHVGHLAACARRGTAGLGASVE